MKLGIIIPTFQEEKNIGKTISKITKQLDRNNLEYEIIVVDDHSSDETKNIIKALKIKNNKIKFYLNKNKRGFGNSVVMGIEKSNSDYIVIMMADNSDSIEDLMKYYEIMLSNAKLDCVFGDRWIKGTVKNYPIFKKILNRSGNFVISKIFRVKYYDFTNSFKIYKRKSLLKIYPILSNHFSITVELPLKMITRGFEYKVIENSWENREHGISKMKLFNSLITYSIILIYCLIDKYFWNKRYVNNK